MPSISNGFLLGFYRVFTFGVLLIFSDRMVGLACHLATPPDGSFFFLKKKKMMKFFFYCFMALFFKGRPGFLFLLFTVRLNRILLAFYDDLDIF